MNKHARLLHKVEVVSDEQPITTNIPAVEVAAPVSHPVSESQPAVSAASFYQDQTPQPQTQPDLSPKKNDNEGMLGVEMDEDEEDGGGKMVWILVGVLILIALVVVGVVVYFSRSRLDTTIVDPVPDEVPVILTVTPEASPSATVATVTPAAKLDLSKVKVQVLNGTTTKGKAAKVAVLLKEVGISTVSTGNSPKLGFEQLQISFKPGAMQLKEMLVEKLDKYGPYGFEELSSTSLYDVVIVVGEKGE